MKQNSKEPVSIFSLLLSHRTKIKINNRPDVPVGGGEMWPLLPRRQDDPSLVLLKKRKGAKGRSKTVAAACFILCLSSLRSQFACLQQEKRQT